jgi:hypothetical protein
LSQSEGNAIIRPLSSSALAEAVGCDAGAPTKITPAKPILIPFSKSPIIKRFHLSLGGALRTLGDVIASRFAMRVRRD